jgi:hypothetical protein
VLIRIDNQSCSISRSMDLRLLHAIEMVTIVRVGLFAKEWLLGCSNEVTAMVSRLWPIKQVGPRLVE